ncbi:MAG: indolepyruvate ferredoxin oxidoreductase [Firmicutes bacterium ADurb.Bin193]|nr:MAG: indolepyruvate ferredoxin oxidoreductase [Firmicutes bacterium ADurb.Bin193]
MPLLLLRLFLYWVLHCSIIVGNDYSAGSCKEYIMKKLLMGNEAIAFGAIDAGVKIVSGYPGTPSTEILETVARENDGGIYVEWSVNEKVALEVAAGASYAGARTMVTMKQVGLNVAGDPLMSLSYIGVKGGMVVVVADDPGPLSSQTEQDTRHYARFSNLPVFDPSTPEEAYEMTIAAFELSEKICLPVFLRPTTRVCHACASVETVGKQKTYESEGFIKDPKWVIFPPLTLKKHRELEQKQGEIANMFEDSPFNYIKGSGTIGVAASGAAYTYVLEALKYLKTDIRLFKVGTPYPMPPEMSKAFLSGLSKVLVVEELDPVIEESLIETAYKNKFDIKIFGKKTDSLPFAGEYSFDTVARALEAFTGESIDMPRVPQAENLPNRPPVLCAGCPHRASFYAVKQAMKGKKAVFTGDIGCYTLGNAKPLEMTDTCLCMGAGITIAQGLHRAEPDVAQIAFVGDSTFFHTGIPGIVNAVYNGTDITVAVLDNSTTAMTGHQPHPGMGKTMMGEDVGKIDIYSILKAIGVGYIERVNPFERQKAIDSVKNAVSHKGVSAVIFEAPCIALFKPQRIFTVKADACSFCKKCIREVGCPAMCAGGGNKVYIEPSLCYGCGLCEGLCPCSAIGVKSVN